LLVQPIPFTSMRNVLIVEDNSADLRRASSVLQGLGFEQIESTTTASAAVRYLDEVAERKRTPPSLIVLDLSLGYESGFEVLRRWKGDARLRPINILVWTQMGEREQELCRLFGLKHIVPKWKSLEEFKSAMQEAVGGKGFSEAS
jgi:CheY-like chemotaxis protein